MGFGAGGTDQYSFGGQQQSVLPGEQNGGSQLSKTPDFSMGLGLDPAMVNQFLQGLADSLKQNTSQYSSGGEAFENYDSGNKSGGFYG